jgi:rhamnosyltransferase subunit B
VFREWMHSPQLVIAFFPEWFARPQPDWPANTHCVGFPLWDAAGHAPIPNDAEKFLKEGEPPVIFTPGSAAATRHKFFEESVIAAKELGIRAMLVTNFAEQLPDNLPPDVRPFGYLPFSEVLPRASLLVHHGGIGTSAQTIKAGIPHIVVPNGHDQFDNAWRIEQLKLGVEIPATEYGSRRVADAITGLLSDEGLKDRCRACADKIDSEASFNRACELIERIGLGRESAAAN